MNIQYDNRVITSSANDETAALAAPPELNELQTLVKDNYKVLQRLGKGAQGSVFLAEDIKTREKVAIKQLHIQAVNDWKKYDLFQREAQTLKRLKIKGVARLHQVVEYLDSPNPTALIIQDYIEGEPLQKFIANGHRFQIGQIGAILLQLLDILEQLHKSDPAVIHRDIKPSNIILNYIGENSTPEVHLIDFGAVSNPQVKGGGSTVVGTYGYMAPEQLMGSAVPASDIYSLAIVAVYLLSGTPPESLEIQDFRVLIDSHLEHLPYQITPFLRQMLEPQLENRLTDYDTIRAFFESIKTQNFSNILSHDRKTNPSKEKSKYKLTNIQTYRQTGNLEIWQSFPDNTPRRISRDIKNQYSIHISSKLILCFSNSNFIFTIFAAIVLASLFAIYKYITPDAITLPAPYNTIVSIFLILCTALIQLFGFVILFYASSAQKSFELNTLELDYFLKNARKSMATVVRIEYIPITPKITDLTDSMKAVSKPTWRIRYSFNPPDDQSENALIHSVDTHAMPTLLKEGDLIPILYLIKKDEINHQELVYSSPFPIPACDKIQLKRKLI